MRKAILLIATAISFVNVKAQIAVGLKAGVNFSKENYKSSTYTTSNHTYFAGGIFAQYSFAKSFALQLEVVHSGEGTHEEYMANNTKVTGVVTINRLNVPLLLQYKTVPGIYFETGPQIGFVLSAKGKYTTGSYDFKPNTNSTLFSWCVGAGYTLTKGAPGLGIGVRYAPGLSHIDKGATNAQSIKGSTINVSVAYAFLHCKKKK